MVLPDSHRVARALWYSGYLQVQLEFQLRAYHPLWGLFPERFIYLRRYLYGGPTTPNGRIHWVWPGPGSLATTTGVSFDFFSSGY